MDWNNNGYDYENRLTNLMWTISGDYDEELDASERFSKLSKDLAFYYTIKAGARRKYIDWKIVKKYLNHRLKKSYKKDTLASLVEICSDELIEDKLIEERPGIEDIRKKALNKLLEDNLKVNPKTLIDKVKFALVLEKIGKNARFDSEVYKLLADIKKCKSSNDTLKLLEYVDKLYINYFSKEENMDIIYDDEEDNIQNDNKTKTIYNEDFSSFLYEELYEDKDINLDVSNIVESISKPILKESIGDFNNEHNLKSNENRAISIDEETAQNIYKKIEFYYGESFIAKNDLRKIENKICRNIHEGCRVHFTDGVLRTKNDNTFQIKYVTKQKEKNIFSYRENPKVYNRNIIKLKEKIIKTLVAQEEKTTISSNSGILVANKLWRVGRSNNTKIFKKVFNNQKGGYAVDILLDASGSQRVRQGKVATQGYIISEALTLAGIPNRVMSFCSFLDYTILRRFRHYDSPKSENVNIFEYYSAGNNRDGLAIKAVSQGLLERDEENKVLIVLSDGKPNDVKIAKEGTKINRSQEIYKGMTALKDTALEVRNARKKRILVLGVFTGKEEDLIVEKFIYGKDFIYTRDIEKFSDIVGVYLKRIIENY